MSQEIFLVYGVLFIAVVLFITEKLRTDLVAILVMLLLAWSGIITLDEAFSGFSSNAVISIMGVMILGYGIESSGLMNLLANKIIQKTGTDEKKILVSTSATVGIISAFMQSIGAVALFLPGIRQIGEQSNISSKKLIMPMSFSAILGGVLTMVASGPLIVLNDLLVDRGSTSFNLFSVTPIGLLLLLSGILLFYFFGSILLPKEEINLKNEEKRNIKKIYNLPGELREIYVGKNSPLIGKTLDECNMWHLYHIHILGISKENSIDYIPWRKTSFEENQSLVLLGKIDDIDNFIRDNRLIEKKDLEIFSNLKEEDYAGFAEIIVPSRSSLIGKSLEEIALRKNFKIEPIVYLHGSGEKTYILDRPMEAGLEIVVFGRWEDLQRIKSIEDLVVMTNVKSPGLTTKGIKEKALFSLLLSFILVIFGNPLSLSFFTGALAMVFLGVIPKEELYYAIGWKTVFLLAGLIPLGIAFEKTKAAELTASLVINIFENLGTLAIFYAIGILGMLFSLFMSNVAATVLLVPLVFNIGNSLNIDPRSLALLVAISTNNSFILPTHQVNAFTMGPGGYLNKDYIKVGSIMSFIFLNISVIMIYLFY